MMLTIACQQCGHCRRRRRRELAARAEVPRGAAHAATSSPRTGRRIVNKVAVIEWLCGAEAPVRAR
jgi:hypothetical protein